MEEEEKYSYTYPDDYWNAELPITGSHESIFLRMGFEFSSFAKGDKMRASKLPHGWSKKAVKDSKWHNILDDRGRIRGKSCEAPNGCFMHPERRFSHGRGDGTNTMVIFEVWDNDVGPGEERRTVFTKSFGVPDRSRHPQIHDQKAQQYADQESCAKWLNTNLSQWNDYSAYWGEEINFAEMK